MEFLHFCPLFTYSLRPRLSFDAPIWVSTSVRRPECVRSVYELVVMYPSCNSSQQLYPSSRTECFSNHAKMINMSTTWRLSLGLIILLVNPFATLVTFVSVSWDLVYKVKRTTSKCLFCSSSLEVRDCWVCCTSSSRERYAQPAHIDGCCPIVKRTGIILRGVQGAWKESENLLVEQMNLKSAVDLEQPSGFILYISDFFFVCSCACVSGGLVGVQAYYSKKKVNIWHQEFLKELNINLKTLIKPKTGILSFSLWVIVDVARKCCRILHHPYAKYTIFHFLLIPFPIPPSIPSTTPNLAIKVSLA